MAAQKREKYFDDNTAPLNTTADDMNIDQGYEGATESDNDNEPRKKRPRTIGNHTPESPVASDHIDTIKKTEESGVSNASKPKVGFLDLPGEVRKKIYDICCDKSPEECPKERGEMCHHCNAIKSSNSDGVFDSLNKLACPCSPNYVYPADLRLVCKQLWRDSTPYFLRSLRSSVFRINFQDNFENGETPSKHGRVLSQSFVEAEWTLEGCRKEQQDSEDVDFAATRATESFENPLADRLLTAFGPTTLVHVGGLEHNFILHYSRKRATLPRARESLAKCPCHDVFDYGRKYLEQGLPEKLMVNIHCYPFITRHYQPTRPRVNKVLLFDKADPADYTKIVEKIWRQCRLSARRITKRTRIDYHDNKKDPDSSRSFGKVIVRFSKMDLDSTFDFEDAEVENLAHGVKMVNLFDTSEDFSEYSDEELIEDGDKIEDESEPEPLEDTSESEEEEEEPRDFPSTWEERDFLWDLLCQSPVYTDSQDSQHESD